MERLIVKRGNVAWAIFGIALLMRFASAPTAGASYFLIAGYALAGRSQAVQALALCWLFGMLNPALAPDSSLSTIGRYAVLACAALSVLARGQFASVKGMPRVAFASLVLGIVIMTHSVLFSPVMDVSILKAASWTVTALTIFYAWRQIDSDARHRLTLQLQRGLLTLMAVSLPLSASGVGYITNGHEFQGVMAQPQAFGPTMALLAAWIGSELLAEPRSAWWKISAFFVCLFLIFLSGARTAAFSVLLGLVLAVILVPMLSRRAVKSVLPGLANPKLYFTGALVLLVGLAAGTLVSDQIDAFVAKRSAVTNVADAYQTSRGELIETMMANIRENPIVGIGFGIASDPAGMVVERDPILGLPVSAVIEKGVLPIAIAEELGIPGLALVVAWLSILVLHAARASGVSGIAVLFTCLLINMGESMLFSPGGMGMLLLLLIGWAITETDTRKGDSRV